MGMPSSQASNAVMYLSYALMLVMGLFIAWKTSKADSFLSGNRTQRGVPLAFNFLASGLYFSSGFS